MRGFNGDLFIVHGSAHIATDQLSDTLIATAPDPDSTAPPGLHSGFRFRRPSFECDKLDEIRLTFEIKMPFQPPKVFISYSHDSSEHKKRVLALAERLRQDGVEARIDRYVNGTPAEGWPRWMDNQLEWTDFVLLVCTETYYRRFLGREEPNKGKGADWEGSLITLELYHARSDPNKFVPVLLDRQDEPFIPRPLLGRTHYVLDTEEEYTNLLALLFGRAGVLPGSLGTMREISDVRVEPMRFESPKAEGRSMGKLHGVPELPPHYLSRVSDFAELKQKLLAGPQGAVITGQARALGVQGMGGIGKTVLAGALAHDSEVRQAFPDGIYWLTIGQKPNLLDLQNQLFRQLTGSRETLATGQEAKDALRQALEGRPALIVIDDAWTIDHADAFSVTAPPARLLITTRNQEVLVGLGAEEHRVDVLSTSDALKMLAEWVGQKSSDKLPTEAAEVAKECGYLPLALAMIGAMIRLRPTAWKDALGRLQRADLAAIKRSLPGYPYPDLLRAVEVSIDALDKTDRERYLDLAVFPQDQPIPENALRLLWKLDEVSTRDCMAQFVACSLATWARSETTLILHDLQRALIHKRRENSLSSLHLRLLEAWNALPKLPDSYAWRWVAYHLAKAGRKDDLRRLLLSFNYLQAKLEAAHPNALIADYDYLADEEELRLIQSAIQLSAHILASDTRQLAEQLTGRLLGNEASNIQALLKQAGERKTSAWLRPLHPNLAPPGGLLIRTLEGHISSVNAVAVTPDGRQVVSASADGTLRVWDLDSGRTVRRLEGHTGWVNAVAVAPDGRRAISASGDETLRIWDLDTGETIRQLQGHLGRVRAVAVTPDGRRAVSASADRTLRVWDLDTGQTIRQLQGHLGRVRAVAVTPDGCRAVSGSADRTLRLWDLESGQTIRTLEGHSDWINAVAVTPDGRRTVSASADRTLRVWDLESGQTVRSLEGHAARVRAVAITPDGHRAVSASADGTLRVWVLDSGQTLRTLKGHADSVIAVAITPDGHHAVSASVDQTLRVWDLKGSQTAHTTPQGHTGRVRAVAVMPDGRQVVSASADRTLRVWDLDSGQTVRTLQGHSDWVRAVAVTPDGRRAVSASADRTLRIWDLDSGQTLRTLEGHTGWVYGVAVTPDGHRTVSASADRTLRVWDLDSGQTVGKLEGHTARVHAVAITSEGHRALSASADGTLRAWDLDSGQTVRVLEGHAGSVVAVAVTPEGHRALSASADGTLRVWDLHSGQTVRVLEGQTARVRAVAVTLDGHYAVSASYDQALRVWDLDSGREIAAFIGESRMSSCAFAPGGRTIIGGDEAGGVHFLRLVEPHKTEIPIVDTMILLIR